MLKIFQLLFILNCSFYILLASGHQYPRGWDDLQSNEGWELIKQTERVKIFSKAMDVSPLPAFRAEIISDVGINKLADAAWLVEKSTEVFPNAYITDAGIYHRRSDTSYTAFQVFNIPFLSPRLYQFNSIRIGNSIHWARTDTVNSTFNPGELLLPPVNFGSWDVKSSGDQSQLIYRICTNPGGNVPLWIIEQANQRYLPLMLVDLETYVKEKVIPE